MNYKEIYQTLTDNINTILKDNKDAFYWEDYGSWDIAKAIIEHLNENYPSQSHKVIISTDDIIDGGKVDPYQFVTILIDGQMIIFSLQNNLQKNILTFNEFYNEVNVNDYHIIDNTECFNERWGDLEKVNNELPQLIKKLFNNIKL